MAIVAEKAMTNVLIVGVGGQGVIMVSKVLALLCQRQGFEVKQSEVHGMAKRGGAVFSHVRFGDKVHSPTIPAGEADVLVALEWAEGLRWLDQLNPDTGVFISDTCKIIPPFSCRDRNRHKTVSYPSKTPAAIIEKVASGFALDATGMASALGNERAANTVLLGLLSTAFSFDEMDWLDIICKFVPEKSIDINRRAFLAGREWAASPTIPEETFQQDSTPALQSAVDCRLEIVGEWCKGCDICVRMCPEKCLELNEAQIVVIPRPEDCTGCRICEWLCPDFAIKLHNTPVAEIAAEAIETEV